MLANLLDKHRVLLAKRLALWPAGHKAGLVEIFGEDWDIIGSSGEKKNFGRQFKAAVKDSRIPNVSWCGIENSGRYDAYLKIK